LIMGFSSGRVGAVSDSALPGQVTELSAVVEMSRRFMDLSHGCPSASKLP
jgi:hypothetical protein